MPPSAIPADLPGGGNGLIDPGFKNYPKNPPASVKDTPGDGSDVTVVTWANANGGVVIPLDQNPMWQAANKALGVNLKVTVVPFADYTTRLPALIAGNDYPDILYINPGAVIPQLPDFLKLKMTDLTPFLSGDAVKDYPNLSAFPPSAWRNVVFNNALYGVVAPYPSYLWIHWVHKELLDQSGAKMPTSADEYKSLLQAMTKPQQSQWGFETTNTGSFTLTTGHFSAIFGAPNQWALDSSGKLTRTIETDQFKQALQYTTDLYKAGVFNPNTLTADISVQRNDMQARRTAFDWDGFQQASQLFWTTRKNLNPPGDYRIVPPFSADGKGKPSYWANNGSFGFSVLKKAPDARIKMLLRVLNYIAAPFGSKEYLSLHYGVDGTDYKMDDNGNPILTDKGKNDTAFPWVYMTQPPGFLYFAGADDYPGVLQDGEKAMYPALVQDPTVGYYSETFASKDTTLLRTFGDGINAIVKGQDPVSNLDNLVKAWRSGGGDQERTEYQSAIQANPPS
ncbi:MAG: extracellular solute-binding protein [Chloroflexi bacterium]|nr:extracellular solute-binding protein [Chloroflexota bacterium]